MKRIGLIIALIILIMGFLGCNQDTTRVFAAETQVMERFKQLNNEGKTEEALDVLDKGMEQFPSSITIFFQRIRLLKSKNRYQECLQWIKKRGSGIAVKYVKEIENAKQGILLKLVQEAAKKGGHQQAFSYFEELANAGYRGFHQLKHNPVYQHLRQMPRFNEMMGKIAKNTGIGQAALDFTAMLSNGESFTLSQQLGKLILIDFWSTQCPPCIEEIPNMRRLYQAYKGQGFEIISISLDEKRAEVEAFLDQNPMPWKSVFSGKGWGDKVARLYKISWIPSLWLVDKEGILRYFDVRGQDLQQAIHQLIQE